ncbi:MAG: glycine betaine/L-proline ABC transporter ATP-binding protein, partial [Alphaproteobacteria bacterium]
MAEQQSKISIESVYKIFGPEPLSVLDRVKAGASKTEILEETGHTIGIRDVSLEIAEGEIFVVMGLSGSGKSTLIRHINRLIEPTDGRILVDGEDVLTLDAEQLRHLRRYKMSMVFQRFALLPHKTVIENVMSGLQIRDTTRQGLLPHKTVLENIAKVLRFQGASKSEAFDQAEKQVELVGLKGFENQYPSQLSGGMQQRVGLARALATDADVLLMDEAFSALDPLIRNDMQDQLIQIQKELNRTIVFITHDLDEALRIGDHIAILKDGELRQVGTPEEILIAPADDYVSRFVKDVNRGRVVTIGSIASEYPTVDLPSATYSDAVAKLKAAESDTCYVLEKGKPVGAVTSKMTENGRDLSGKITSADQLDPILTVDSVTVLEEMMTLAVNSEVPVAVLNDSCVLVGGLPRRTVM